MLSFISILNYFVLKQKLNQICFPTVIIQYFISSLKNFHQVRPKIKSDNFFLFSFFFFQNKIGLNLLRLNTFKEVRTVDMTHGIPIKYLKSESKKNFFLNYWKGLFIISKSNLWKVTFLYKCIHNQYSLSININENCWLKRNDTVYTNYYNNKKY